MKKRKKTVIPLKTGTNPPGELYNKALELSQSVSLEELFLKTRLPISWLRKFRAGAISNPSVNRIEKIIVELTGEKIL